jgi:hypothetical protein
MPIDRSHSRQPFAVVRQPEPADYFAFAETCHRDDSDGSGVEHCRFEA